MAFFECLVGGSGDGSTLTVTCYSGFAGLTISITNGVDTFSDVCPSTSPYEVVFDGLADGTWTLSTVCGGDTYTKTVEINAVAQFYPIPDGETVTPTDDIQTWLHCADIWDKAYTTISEVLADTSTLLALINSNNAADYMARSTTWASNVCTNAVAMGYIGNNDYCANALLDDSTWCAAICNSSYFESVLNYKVPTMTSNTTPSGEAFSSSNTYSANPAYLAFDNNFNTYWGTSSTTSGQIGYKFPSKMVLKKFHLDMTYYNIPYTCQVKGSNDGVTYENIGNAFTVNSGTKDLDFISNNTGYEYIMLDITVGTTMGIVAHILQFYGRAV